MKNLCTDDERAEAIRRGQEQVRREWDQAMETLRRVCGGIGFPLICPEPACGRARRCAGQSRGLPPCWELYREEARYFLNTLMRLHAHIEATGERPDPAAPKPDRPLTLIEALYGPDLSRLRRPKDAPEAMHGPESDPDAFDRYILAGDWREPFRAPSGGSGTKAGCTAPVRPTHGLPRQGEDDASGLQPEDALDQSLRKITLASQPNKSASAAVTPP